MIRGVPRTPSSSAAGAGAGGGSSSSAGPSRLSLHTPGTSSSTSFYSPRARAGPYFNPGTGANHGHHHQFHAHQQHHHRPLHATGAVHTMNTAPASVSAQALLGHETEIEYFTGAQHTLSMQDPFTRTLAMSGEYRLPVYFFLRLDLPSPIPSPPPLSPFLNISARTLPC